RRSAAEGGSGPRFRATTRPTKQREMCTRGRAALREQVRRLGRRWTTFALARRSFFTPPSRLEVHSRFSGGHGGGAIPDPIPNSEVKPSCADGTAGATLWESRSLPDLCPQHESAGGFFIGFTGAML